MNTKITVIDSLMGSGKSSWAIQHMNEDIEGSFIYITPFLSEVQRIKDSCSSKKFIEPKNFGKGKLESFNELLKKNRNISSTHALFKMADEDTKDLIKANDYTLILDEVMDVVTQIPMKKDDLPSLLELKLITIHDNGVVTWNDEEYDGEYNHIKTMCKNNSVFMVNNCLLMWTFPVEVFKSFKEVYVLTYLFNGQIQRYYYDLYDVKYEYRSIALNNELNKYEIVEYIDKYDLSDVRKLIHIIEEDDKLNRIGDDKYSFSKSWLSKKELMYPTIVKNMINYFKHRCTGKSGDNMWCTFKLYKGILSGKGYTKGFVSLGSRATNDYVDKKNLAYCANIFLNPMMEHFFTMNNVKVNEDIYALSEFIQWIWRSQIRRGDEINLYVPSSRMRSLLIDWLENVTLEVPK